MDYLHQFYGMLFGNGEQQSGVSVPRKIVAFGNVLIDRSAQLPDTTLLEKYQISLNTKGELDAETLSKISAEACDHLECSANPGGSALNTVRVLKKLGLDAVFFGAVGDDKNAEELREILKQRGVEARLQIIPDEPTGQCICLLYEDSATLYANIGASAKFSIEYLKKSERDDTLAFLRPIERKQILYIEGFFVPQREHVCEFIVTHYIRERRRLAFNLSAPYILAENFEQILYLARNAYFIFGNQNEFDMLSEKMGTTSVEEMAKKLLQDGGGVKVIVVTKGADGVQLITNFVSEYEEPGPITYQSYNVPRIGNVLDTTGAGDAFVAGFLLAWLEKRSLSESVRLATDVAAQVVTQMGCNLPEDFTWR